MSNFSASIAIQEYFEKGGKKYRCDIAPLYMDRDNNQFEVLLRLSGQEACLRFILTPAGDGHWLPDDKANIAPWVADRIGGIILNNF